MFHKDSQDSQREIGRPSFPPPSYHSQAGSWENVKILSHCVLLKRKKKYKFVELLKTKKFPIENKVELLAGVQTRQKR